MGYFHLIFTVPPGLNPMFLRAPKLAYSLLFRAAGESLLEVAKDPRHLGARVGAVAVLHTWGQQLQMHPYVHCIVPGGGLSPGGERWILSASDFLVPVKVLSQEFRKKLLRLIQRACHRDETLLPDDLDPVNAPNCYRAWLAGLEATKWVVYSKRPFGGAERGLEYLARYTHRVAISNERLLAIRDGRVVFRWKDYRSGGDEKVTSLAGVEFARRFLQHVLPRGFQRIRYYGLLANRHRKENLERCRRLLVCGCFRRDPGENGNGGPGRGEQQRSGEVPDLRGRTAVSAGTNPGFACLGSVPSTARDCRSPLLNTNLIPRKSSG